MSITTELSCFYVYPSAKEPRSGRETRFAEILRREEEQRKEQLNQMRFSPKSPRGISRRFLLHHHQQFVPFEDGKTKNRKIKLSGLFSGILRACRRRFEKPYVLNSNN